MSPAAVTDRLALTSLLAPLAGDAEHGIHYRDEFASWRDHLATAQQWARVLGSVLSPTRPPHVGVLLPNVPEFSVLFAAAAMSDVVLVGLNPTRRGAALADDIARSDCQLVLTGHGLGGLITESGTTAPTFDVAGHAWAELLAAHPAPPAPVAVPEADPDALLMLIFTSGTTGAPKAVRCSQRKFAAAGAMLAERFRIGADDVVYLSMPMFHSNALIAGWSVAAAGKASIALRERFSASGFGDDVRRYGVTYANYVGKPLHYILTTPERSDDAQTSLRLMYGNEATAADRAEFERRFGARVVDGFGSTEGGVSITRTPETPDDALGPLRGPVAVVDPDTLAAVPAGTVGEIVNSSGAGLFDGYYRDEEATAERLRGGFYRTGDLGWVDEAGFVHFAGRTGDWLRVDGENLGTTPIEQILRRHPQIVDCAVFGVPREIGDDVGAALVAPGLTLESLTGFLAAQSDLGPKQRPTAVWIVDDLPQTATFKVRRSELVTSLGTPTWELPPVR